MAELLCRRQSGTNEGGSVRRAGVRREVPDLLSWVQCFGTYIGVVASRYPERVRQLLARCGPAFNSPDSDSGL